MEEFYGSDLSVHCHFQGTDYWCSLYSAEKGDGVAYYIQLPL